ITSWGLLPFAGYRILLAAVILLAGCAAPWASPNMRFGMSQEQVARDLGQDSPIISRNADTIVTTGTAKNGQPCMRILKFEKNRLARVEDHYQ
ncbi:MAG: hypothetical protein HY594_02895, partial [Candidatus Omnitrophica bacterium]|nr:hypothetical protein [Candidatus Omnitrophota bacterium]